MNSASFSSALDRIASNAPLHVNSTFKALYGVLAVAHLVVIVLTASRSFIQLVRRKAKFDDVYATISMVGVSIMCGALLDLVSLRDGLPTAPAFACIFSLYFLVVWSSRISLALTTIRLYSDRDGPITVILSILVECMAFIAAVYCIVTAMYLTYFDCSVYHDCLRRLPLLMIVFGLICDIGVDALVLFALWFIFRDEPVARLGSQRLLLVPAFSGNLIILVATSTLWCLMLTDLAQQPLIILGVSNTVASVSVFSCNLPFIFGTIYRWHYGTCANKRSVSVASLQTMQPPPAATEGPVPAS